MSARAVWLGTVPYRRAHALQQALVARRKAGTAPDLLLLLEHPPTITIGRHRGASTNVLSSEDVDLVEVERGGDVTWHAPGQLVVYPLVALEGPRQDLHDHLARVAEGASIALRGLGLAPHPDPRNTGAWLTGDDGVSRKVCSIGIACRSWVTWHGMALNLDLDLAGFARINPCGFSAEVMTRVADHVPMLPDGGALRQSVADGLAEALELGAIGPVVDGSGWSGEDLDQLAILVAGEG